MKLKYWKIRKTAQTDNGCAVFKSEKIVDILQRNMWKNIVDTFFKEEYNMSEWNRKTKSKTLRKEDVYAI